MIRSRPKRSSASTVTDLPLQVGLLIDASESVTSRFKVEQEPAIEFLKDTIRPRYDQAFVIGFDLTPTPLTRDKTSKVRTPAGHINFPVPSRPMICGAGQTRRWQEESSRR